MLDTEVFQRNLGQECQERKWQNKLMLAENSNDLTEFFFNCVKIKELVYSLFLLLPVGKYIPTKDGNHY